jgi:hypothetical protein
MNPALGGTATLGGVNVYWFGYRNAFTKDIDRRVLAWGRRLSYPQEFYVWGKKDAWSPELKAFALLEMCVKAGVDIYFNALTFGTLVQGDRVAGVVAATPYGPRAFLGKVTVDATGDADVAAFAGAGTTYGNERDRLTLWAALNYFNAPGKYKAGNFTTTVDVGDILDCTRFILANRRRGGESLYDHSRLIAPRESRHIHGEIVLGLSDQILMRRFPDTISLCFSNHDPKGRSIADLIYFGLLPPHLEIEIPYRAMLPARVDGLLVTGKALSCTHDALAAIRMIDDLQQQGGAVGLAAALCVKNHCQPRDLDIKPLQERLVRKGLLPQDVLEPARSRPEPDYAQLIDRLSGDEPFEWLEMSVRAKAVEPSPLAWLCTARPAEIVPLLLAAHAGATGSRRLLLARLLLWHGQEAGLDEVFREIRRLLAEEPGLPSRKGSVRFCNVPPDHGVMAEVIYLINLLSRVHSHESIQLLVEVVGRIERAERDYRDFRQSIFNYIECVAYVTERLALSGCIPLLERLLALPELRNRICTAGWEIDILGERQATLALCLNRALARCGSRQGLLGLASFTADNRALLARSARDELVALTGIDHGGVASDWLQALENWPETFEPQPWTVRMD